MRVAALLTLLIVASGVAQQPNSATASMTLDAVSGPTYPIAKKVHTNTVVTIALAGTPSAPLLIATSATGVVQAGTLATGGGIVDLPLIPAPFIAVEATLDPFGALQLPVAVPPPGPPPAGIPLGHQEALQAVIADPASAVGYTLTAATQVTVFKGLTVVTLALGSDGAASLNLAPYGFSVPFYGTSYSQLWLCVNGFLTFGSPDTDFSPSILEFNSGYPRIAAFWSDLEQQAGATGQIVRYTIDPSPPGAAPAYVQAEWINVPDWGVGFVHTFSAAIDATGLCRISLGPSASLYGTLCGIGPGLNLNPQGSKDLSVLHGPGYAGGVDESLFELFNGFGGGGNAFDLFGVTLNFQPNAGGQAPGSSASYLLY